MKAPCFGHRRERTSRQVSLFVEPLEMDGERKVGLRDTSTINRPVGAASVREFKMEEP